MVSVRSTTRGCNMQNPKEAYKHTIGKLGMFPAILCWVMLTLELVGIWQIIKWMFNIY